MAWCGFIDLLGTKESANASLTKLKLSLSAFHNSLQKNFHLLGDGTCFAFSDGAFFQTTQLSNFIRFYQSTRRDLFANANFFKCAVIQGDLQADTELTKAGDFSAIKSGFWSVRFGDKAAQAFMDQDLFKGIGAVLSQSSIEDSNFVRSFYFSSERLTSARQYIDIRFTNEEVNLKPTHSTEDPLDMPIDDPSMSSGDFIYNFIKEASIAKARSNKYARYYIPTLASMIRSQDFSMLEFDDGAWIHSPILFDIMFMGKSVSREFSSVPGFSFLFWTFVDEIWKQKNSDMSNEAKEALVLTLSSKRNTFKDVGLIPDFIVSHAVREEVLSIKANIDMSLK